MKGIKNCFRIIMIGTIIAIVSVLFISLTNGSRLFLSNMKMSDQEQEEIASFYDINTDAIVEGDFIDFKYVYKDDNRPFRSNVIEIVMKNDETITLDGITFYDKNRRRMCAYSGTEEDFTIISDPRFQLIFYPAKGYETGYLRRGFLQIDVCQVYFRRDEITDLSKYDLNEIELIITTKTGLSNFQKKKETIRLVYDEEKQFMASKQIKEQYKNGYECNAYEKRQISYYFGILFNRDFEQWYTEIKDYLSYVKEKNDCSTVSLSTMLNYPCEEELESEDLQKFMNLNDDQYVKYKEVMQIIENLDS